MARVAGRQELDHDEEMGAMHEMYGTLDEEFEVQCTIKRTELTAFLSSGKPSVLRCTLTMKESFGGLWRGERRCTGPGGKDLDLWILNWEGVAQSSSRRHTGGGRARPSTSLQKGMQDMTLVENFITEGNEKADELAQEGERLDGEDLAQVRAIAIQQEREEVYAALQYAASFHCLVEEWKDCEELRPKPPKVGLGNKKGEAKKHRTEWCSKHMNIQGNM